METKNPDVLRAIDSEASFISDFFELIKARLNALVVVTTLAGFYLGWEGPMHFLRLFHVLFGTWLVAAGTAALNQFIERELDSKMARTCLRPLPAQRLDPNTVLLIGFGMAVGGLLYLSFFVNLLTAVLGALTLGIYLFVYTPLKQITTLNTLIGAIPGAIPPIMGWTAATGSIGMGALAIAGILFFWQMPHFFAIAWIFREDYAKGGFVMVPIIDADGSFTGRLCVNYGFALLLVSLLPSIIGLTTVPYFFGALLLGVLQLISALRLQLQPSIPRARQLFFVSIIYLPLLLAWCAICKV